MKCFFVAAIWLGMVASGVAQTLSPLFARSYYCHGRAATGYAWR